ncbi:hypothetical protein M9194_21130 [Vibrio sp. S4M6]|uniref:hypothetical protein n=1 Tax=Vibrio sinus TaxID=2946865 RepID=UPI002029B875|nr:hypothetical protein [Vibrio sinus]MCL9783927.1 hypothetical protein [Vibrio sinus]
MARLTKDKAIVVAKGLNLPDIVVDIIAGNIPSSLVNYFSAPMYYDLTLDEQNAYGFESVLPLWADTNGNLIFSYDKLNDDYFCFYWDGTIESRYSTWNDLMKDTMSLVIENIWEEQSEDEVLNEVKFIFNRFEVGNIDDVFNSIVR